MGDNNITNLIGSARFKIAQNKNTNVQLELENTSKQIIEYDIDSIVDQEELFNQEREASKKYRINGRLNILTSNAISPNATSKYWDPLFYGSPRPSPANWLMQICYPSKNDYYTKVGTYEAYFGLEYTSLGTTLVNGDNRLTLYGLQLKHNVKAGEYVYIYSTTNFNPLQGFHYVLETGVGGKFMERVLTLDTIVTNAPTGVGSFLRITNPSFDDIKFNNPSEIIAAVASDINGVTTGQYNIGDEKYVTITTTLPHKLIVNNFVDIRTGNVSKLNGLWRVYNILSSTKFVIKNYVGQKGTPMVGFNKPKWRLLDGTPSEYYIRKFEVLTANDYNVNKCAFSQGIYSDNVANDTWLFQFEKDINVQNLRTNRNGEISELYYTIIKRAGVNPYPFGNVTSHWDFSISNATDTNGLEYISKVKQSNIGTIEKATARSESIQNGRVIPIEGSFYFGDFVEFNSIEIREYTISEIVHRFGVDSVLNKNPVNNYYYKPFRKLQIRKYSNNIETTSVDEIYLNRPGDAVIYADGTVSWRDLLTIGFYEEGDNGVNYPFLNDAHYFYFNHILYVRLQLPIIEPINLEESFSVDPNDINTEC